MEQEHAGHRLHDLVGKRQLFPVALHQLRQFARNLREPAAGLTQVRRGEIQAHQLRFGQGTPQLTQGAAGACGDVQHADGVSAPATELIQQGANQAAAHGISGAVEEDLDLQVVELG